MGIPIGWEDSFVGFLLPYFGKRPRKDGANSNLALGLGREIGKAVV
jgi:hypothetical protein